MSRRSLRPQLNQIRAWVRQGRTDAWIAHQLEVTVQQIQTFKREQGLDSEPATDSQASDSEEVDLRAEDDAVIAAELEAEEAIRQEEQRKAEEERKAAEAKRKESEPEDDGGAGAEKKPRRRRSTRSRRRTPSKGPLEGTFDHGEEGFGLWLDPAIQDNPTYAEHWAGHRSIVVEVDEEQIVIRRVEESTE